MAMQSYTPPMDPVRIVFEDQDIVVVDKPAGLLSVPAAPLSITTACGAGWSRFTPRSKWCTASTWPHPV